MIVVGCLPIMYLENVLRRSSISFFTRSFSSVSPRTSPHTRHFQVVLDGETLYIEKPLAEALGWSKESGHSVPLRLSGWDPAFFAITPVGTDADLLAQGTIDSSQNSKVKEVLRYLKEADLT